MNTRNPAPSLVNELKRKYLDIVDNLPPTKLKSFSKWPYVHKMENELKILQPDLSEDTIKSTCHFIGNALNNRAIDRRASCPKSTPITLESPDQSFLTKMVTTPLKYISSKLVTVNNSGNDDLNNPLSKLSLEKSEKKKKSKKKKVHNPRSSAASVQHAQNEVFCISNCKHNRSDDGEMIRCSLCWKWFHMDCLDVNEEEANRYFWPCLLCRALPQNISHLIDDVADLKVKNNSLVTELDALKFEIGALRSSNVNLNTLLSEKISENEMLREKCGKFQDECMILRGKLDSMNEKYVAPLEGRTPDAASINNKSLQRVNIDATASIVSHSSSTNAAITNANSSLSPPPLTLFIGDSIVRDVTEGTSDSKVICLPGTTIDQLRMHLHSTCADKLRPNEIVIEVGTVDCSMIKDPDSILADYKLLLKEAKQISNGKVTVLSICPRVDDTAVQSIVDEVNHLLSTLCERERCCFIDNDSFFRYRNNEIVSSLLLRDGVHLSYAGVDLLLRNGNLTSLFLTKRKSSRPTSSVPVYNSGKYRYRFTSRDSGSTQTWRPWSQRQGEFRSQRFVSQDQRDEVRRHPPDAPRPGYATRFPRNAPRPGNATRFPHDGPRPGYATRPLDRDWHDINSQFQTTSTNRRVRCYLCGEEGHIQRVCRHGVSIRCWNCGSLGHKQKSCTVRRD
ncbi:uncharacterized protein [Ptychodera flava]|uniref:uncharacterized protein n=1 Tax=Ptychodera flava TaxID=63121 RepID=UPI00396A9FF2